MPTRSDSAPALTTPAPRTAPLTEPPSPRIPELDGLRGLAILLVILCHYVGNAQHASLGLWPHRALSAFSAGWSGVDLFFVLSGFLIGGILVDARATPHYFRAFYMRRVHRILPVYFAWTLLFAIIAFAALVFAPGKTSLVPHDLIQVPIHLFFLQNIWIGMPHFPWVWFVVTWSLAVEEQFYLLTPPLLRFFSLRSVAIILSAAILLAPLFRLAIFRLTANPFAASFPMPGRADALAWGVLLAMAWRLPRFRRILSAHALRLQALLAGLFLGVLALLWWLARPAGYVTLSIGLSWLALFYSALLLLAISQTSSWPARFLRTRWLRSLGTISYCVYILHDTFNLLIHKILLHSDPRIDDASGIALTILALVLSLAVASFSWRFFEKPLIRRGHLYTYGEATA